MCTVTYLPKGTGGFYLTSNRDEAPSRATQQLVRKQLGNGSTLLFPQDPAAGGTWLALSDQGRVICLLNGAFEHHHRQPPYRRSRGLVLLDAFEYGDPEDFFANYQFSGIESFTMVWVEKGTLQEFRWDGQKQYQRSLDAEQAHIWSSATLYNQAYREKRERLFEQFLRDQPNPELEDILQFHQSGGTGDAYNDFVMNRHDLVRTVSITAVTAREDRFQILHKDLLKDTLVVSELAAPSNLISDEK